MAAASVDGEALTEDQLKQLQDLKERDRDVRAHEAANMAGSGRLATGGATSAFQPGRDGGTYAIGGEVNIDTSPVASDPEATIREAETIRRAALARSDPTADASF